MSSVISNQDFKILLFQLAESLEARDREGIIFIYGLPPDLEKQSALKILLRLEMDGKISATEPSLLEEIFKNIKRMDLAKRVKEFAKSQKKKKTNTSKIDNSRIDFYANVEVALTQARLLQDQIEHLQKIDCSSRTIEAAIQDMCRLTEKLRTKLLSVKEQHQLTDSCSESDTSLSPPVTLNRAEVVPFNLELNQQLATSLLSKKMHQRPPQSKSFRIAS